MSTNLHAVLSLPPDGVTDEQFSDWYDAHLAEILAVPGFNAARRYALTSRRQPVGPARLRFLSLYEIDDDVPTVMANLWDEGRQSAMKLPDWFAEVQFSSYNCFGLNNPTEPVLSDHLLCVFSEPPASIELDDYIDWYVGHLAENVEVDGYDTGWRFRLEPDNADQHSDVQIRHLALYQLSADWETLMTNRKAFVDAGRATKPDWFGAITFAPTEAIAVGPRVTLADTGAGALANRGDGPMSGATIEVQGSCDPAFAAVRDAFASNFADFGEVGASVALTVDGRPVVDLWAGYVDTAKTQPWQRDTIVNVYSSTKGVMALAGAIAVGRNLIDYDAKVVDYWPEFARGGKDEVLVRQLFDHSVGLPYPARGVTYQHMLDWQTMTNSIENQPPIWTPGSETGYHAFTYGWLTGILLRRQFDKPVSAIIRDEIAGPLGTDFFISTPVSEHHRIADIILAERPEGAPAPGAGVLPQYALDLHDTAIEAVNTKHFRLAELPGANGHGNARALARIYGALSLGGELDGVRLTPSGAVDAATAVSAQGYDRILERDVRRGAGFTLSTTEGRAAFGPSPRIFGHTGAGGSIGFADPDAHLGFGYAMNRMRLDPGGDSRWLRLSEAVYSCV